MTVKGANNQRRDNENNRRKRTAKLNKRKTNKDRKEQGEQKLSCAFKKNYKYFLVLSICTRIYRFCDITHFTDI